MTGRASFGNAKSYGVSSFDPSDPASQPLPPAPPAQDQFHVQYAHLFGAALEGDFGEAGIFIGGFDNVQLSIDGNQKNLLAAGALAYGVRVGTTDKADRVRIGGDNADAIAVNALGDLLVLGRDTVFNGTTWDRRRAGSAANLGARSSLGAAIVANIGQFGQASTPGAAVQATTTRAAGGPGVRHVCTVISWSFSLPAAVVQAAVQINLRDGASGVGAILWSKTYGGITGGATALYFSENLSGLCFVGTAATAMTLEFSAAGAATTIESVSLGGYDAL